MKMVKITIPLHQLLALFYFILMTIERIFLVYCLLWVATLLYFPQFMSPPIMLYDLWCA
jgi:hypothetical protein